MFNYYILLIAHYSFKILLTNKYRKTILMVRYLLARKKAVATSQVDNAGSIKSENKLRDI